VVVDGVRGDPTVDLYERILSAGCAVQNILLMATAQGFGSALTSGKALKSIGLRNLFDLQAHDHALCFISVGTVHARKAPRILPSPAQYVAELTANSGLVNGLPLDSSDFSNLP
jgi:nitroreductase